MVFVLITGCEKNTDGEASMSNSYKSESEVAEETVGSIRLRIPKHFHVLGGEKPVLKRSSLKKDKEGNIWVDVDFSQWLSDPPAHPSYSNGLVTIEIIHGRSENLASGRLALESWDWAETRVIEEWNLKEFVRRGYGTGWGWYTYAVPGEIMKTPKGGLIFFECQGTEESGPWRCITGFELREDLYVSYMQSHMMLPQWKAVRQAIIEMVNSWIVVGGKDR